MSLMLKYLLTTLDKKQVLVNHYTIGQDGSGDLKRITFNVAPDVVQKFM